jgi:hypothetical protein
MMDLVDDNSNGWESKTHNAWGMVPSAICNQGKNSAVQCAMGSSRTYITRAMRKTAA